MKKTYIKAEHIGAISLIVAVFILYQVGHKGADLLEAILGFSVGVSSTNQLRGVSDTIRLLAYFTVPISVFVIFWSRRPDKPVVKPLVMSTVAFVAVIVVQFYLVQIAPNRMDTDDVESRLKRVALISYVNWSSSDVRLEALFSTYAASDETINQVWSTLPEGVRLRLLAGISERGDQNELGLLILEAGSRNLMVDRLAAAIEQLEVDTEALYTSLAIVYETYQDYGSGLVRLVDRLSNSELRELSQLVSTINAGGANTQDYQDFQWFMKEAMRTPNLVFNANDFCGGDSCGASISKAGVIEGLGPMLAGATGASEPGLTFDGYIDQLFGSDSSVARNRFAVAAIAAESNVDPVTAVRIADEIMSNDGSAITTAIALPQSSEALAEAIDTLMSSSDPRLRQEIYAATTLVYLGFVLAAISVLLSLLAIASVVSMAIGALVKDPGIGRLAYQSIQVAAVLSIIVWAGYVVVATQTYSPLGVLEHTFVNSMAQIGSYLVDFKGNY